MRIVVKIGTNVLSKSNGTLDTDRMQRIVGSLAAWHAAGWQVVVVSSGAIGAGMGCLGLKKRPKIIKEKQAAAAVGQVHLMEQYSRLFAEHHVHIGQVLLTRDDLTAHKRYLNTRNTLTALLDMRIIPIINENDTVSVDEIVVGDNDTLSAIVATKIEANKLVILTDVDGICTSDPKSQNTVKCIPVIDKITAHIERICSSKTGSVASIGGMHTKLLAAKIATRAGVEVIIANGKRGDTLDAIFTGKQAGTTFLARGSMLTAKKKWIAFGAQIQGKICVDAGAADALVHRNRSLLPAGVIDVEGCFASGDIVSIVDAHRKEIARGMSSYTSDELRAIQGVQLSKVKDILQCDKQSEVIHRDNLVIL